MYIDFIRKRQEVLQLHKMKDLETDEHDAVLDGSIVNIVYDNAVEEIEDVNFALSFIQIALEFDFASRHVDHILEDVQRRHPDKEETLDALAKRPLLYIEDEIKRGKEMGLKKKVIMHRICQEIYSRYDEAVERITTEKMWSYYLDFVHNYLKSAKEKKRAKVQSILINKLEKAAEANCLSLNYYAVWIDLLFEKGDDDAALSVSLMAARKWNQVSLWIKCLTLHIRSGKSSKKVYLLFSEALSSLNEKDSISLWKLGVEWLSFADPERLIEFFEKGINKCTEISTPLKDMYLEATALRNGTQAARDLYKRFKKMGPLSPQVVRKMIIIEKAQLRPSIDSLRKYYEDGIREFGSS
ncbi:U3 small nucleolar RNA-associated protein 6-like protein, partial [Stegodyphus mimosarum]